MRTLSLWLRRLLTWLFDKRVLEAINRGDSYASVVALVDRLTCDKQRARAAQGVGAPLAPCSLGTARVGAFAHWCVNLNKQMEREAPVAQLALESGWVR